MSLRSLPAEPHGFSCDYICTHKVAWFSLETGHYDCFPLKENPSFRGRRVSNYLRKTKLFLNLSSKKAKANSLSNLHVLWFRWCRNDFIEACGVSSGPTQSNMLFGAHTHARHPGPKHQPSHVALRLQEWGLAGKA